MGCNRTAHPLAILVAVALAPSVVAQVEVVDEVGLTATATGPESCPEWGAHGFYVGMSEAEACDRLRQKPVQIYATTQGLSFQSLDADPLDSVVGALVVRDGVVERLSVETVSDGAGPADRGLQDLARALGPAHRVSSFEANTQTAMEVWDWTNESCNLALRATRWHGSTNVSLRIEVYPLQEWKQEREHEETVRSRCDEARCSNEPVHVSCVDYRPVLVAGTMARAEVPEEARRECVSGTVRVAYIVKRDGTVGDVSLVEAPNPDGGLARTVVESLRGWRYTPAQCDGTPVAVRGMSYTFVYDPSAPCETNAGTSEEVRPGCQ